MTAADIKLRNFAWFSIVIFSFKNFSIGATRETHPHLYTEHCWNVENRQGKPAPS
jgi:hypothetical protein